MLSSKGELNDTAANGQQMLTTPQSRWEEGGDREQIFYLIDNLLSFEACLYHQILPFGLKDKNLLLGMVHPQDNEALDYVGRILSSINCTMVIEAIAADAHRRILSAYLNHKNTSQLDAKVHQATVDSPPTNSPATIADTPSPSLDADSESNQQPILMVFQTQKRQNSRQQVDLPPIPELDQSSQTTTFLTPIFRTQQEENSEATSSNNLPILPTQASELLSSMELLKTLPTKKILEELLRRILAGGIGRLYLERQASEGRILWSDNGVLQSVLDKLPLSVFQGVLNELKRFASLPIITVAEPKQVEKEYVYQKNRLLLRLRVMPGIYGEEATLQVLRGAALKFYQQQQLTRLGRDALGISQQLSIKLHELQERLLLNPSLDSQQLEALVALNQLVKNLDQQIKILALDSNLSTKSKSSVSK
ncbi:pilus assembly protein PilB [Nostoc sp. 'Lobaria pulmonaria (5183) cyanobiont']|uniref:pilus assembly protein PilB n=1 Tax=Nostoc sp. 'Lobaria pulmonaria (5183) cyanobiont' TaxID=1618022 RepID=UPI000CF33837|nr:pilus assembly protein PilB [Nostoc sp. 'Lobaria pulmonaria (5183) cyanobiont']AVH73469.1 general secretory system II protein E domain-containing protein [Nostoc sp. 'Lobaria pulmonaria (5183) cyanobiont']